MKTKLFMTFSLVLAITGCQKESEQAEASTTAQQNSEMVEQFEVADNKIGNFLDQLDNPETSMETRQQIICIDYPDIYQDEYVPSLLKLSPDNTKEQLDHDLKLALDYYKNKDNVECN